MKFVGLQWCLGWSRGKEEDKKDGGEFLEIKNVNKGLTCTPTSRTPLQDRFISPCYGD